MTWPQSQQQTAAFLPRSILRPRLRAPRSIVSPWRGQRAFSGGQVGAGRPPAGQGDPRYLLYTLPVGAEKARWPTRGGPPGPPAPMVPRCGTGPAGAPSFGTGGTRMWGRRHRDRQRPSRPPGSRRGGTRRVHQRPRPGAPAANAAPGPHHDYYCRSAQHRAQGRPADGAGPWPGGVVGLPRRPAASGAYPPSCTSGSSGMAMQSRRALRHTVDPLIVNP